MAIVSIDDWIASNRIVVPICRLATRVTVANQWFSMFDLAGCPGAGTLAGTSTTAGVVPTDATAGCPIITNFSGTGYVTGVQFANTVACRLQLFDMLWKGGAYAYNSGTTTLSAQPTYASRVPGGDYNGIQIWIEVSTAFVTGSTWSVTVNYADQSAGAGTTVSTGNLTVANLILGRMIQLPLGAGDSGVQWIVNVAVTTGGMTAGAFNVLVLRPLWQGRVFLVNGGDAHTWDRTAWPQVYGDSALVLAVNADSTSSGLPDTLVQIASR